MGAACTPLERTNGAQLPAGSGAARKGLEDRGRVVVSRRGGRSGDWCDNGCNPCATRGWNVRWSSARVDSLTGRFGRALNAHDGLYLLEGLLIQQEQRIHSCVCARGRGGGDPLALLPCLSDINALI